MSSLQRMRRFMRPYRWIVGIGLFTVILPVMMELTVPRMLQYIIDRGIRAGNMDAIIKGTMIMLGAAFIGALATLGQGVCRARLSQGVAFDLRNELFTHTQALSFGNLDQMQTGRLMTRLSSDVNVVRGFSSHALSLMLRAVLMITGSVVMLAITDWRLSCVVLVLLCIAFLFIRNLMWKARPLFLLVQQKLAALNTIVQENLAGIDVVKAFVREQFEIERFDEHNRSYMQQQIQVGRIIAVALPVLAIVTNLGTVAVIWLGGLNVIGGRLSMGELIAFNNYVTIGMTPLMLLGNMLTMVSRAESSAARILEVLDSTPRIQSPSAPHYAKDMAGHVAFDCVSFHYDGDGGEEVLDNISIAIEAGQKVALLGATGSGKSTFINLIPRFYDVTGGQLRIHGVDVRDWEPESLRSHIGIVLQQSTLFSGTIRENIAYGKSDAPLDDVMAAAGAAQAHDFIMAMPEGYESDVEARGANLSGGQKQRIAIARALLIAPTILILDDSTSAVDLDTEVKIQQALDILMAGRTTFIVAQRINSVLNADRIIVLDNGRIAAQGSHAQLLHSSPIYQEIYHSQLDEEQGEAHGAAKNA
ncbi:MAG: ABC transporter ATP-binding protein [bacterium]|nr:ABC transporter ATP-binding protein [bacterium]